MARAEYADFRGASQARGHSGRPTSRGRPAIRSLSVASNTEIGPLDHILDRKGPGRDVPQCLQPEHWAELTSRKTEASISGCSAAEAGPVSPGGSPNGTFGPCGIDRMLGIWGARSGTGLLDPVEAGPLSGRSSARRIAEVPYAASMAPTRCVTDGSWSRGVHESGERTHGLRTVPSIAATKFRSSQPRNWPMVTPRRRRITARNSHARMPIGTTIHSRTPRSTNRTSAAPRDF
jgi:hypothetical protein